MVDSPPELYRNPETGTELSIYDLAHGARHAELDTTPDEGPEGAIRFDGDLYLPVDTSG